MAQKKSLVAVRPLQASYIENYLKRFSLNVRRVVHAPSLDEERYYLYEQLESQRRGESRFYCVFNVQNDELIGAVAIRNRTDCPGQLYCWLHEDFWGGGYFQQALALAAERYFKATGCSFFTAHVDITNKRSYYALKKAGFEQIGYYAGPFGRQYALILEKKELCCAH